MGAGLMTDPVVSSYPGRRDENGHEWGQTFMDERFPLVCIRCLIRSDNPGSDQACDAVAERIAARSV